MGKYLVTGGCGFIGSHLVQALHEQGHIPYVIDDLSSGKKEYLPPGIPLFIGSINDPKKLEELLAQVEGVFHLAAIPSVEKSVKEWVRTHQTNLTGTLQLFESVAKLKTPIPIIYASSAAIYGNCNEMPLRETTSPSPSSPYGIDKLACEWGANIAWQLHGIPSVGFRIFNVFGPRQNPDSAYSGVITRFIKTIRQGRPLLIYGNGQQSRDFIAVEDVVTFFLKAMASSPSSAEIYNLCTGRGTTIYEVVEVLEKLFKKTLLKEYAPQRKGEIFQSVGDPAKAEKEFQIYACTSLSERLEVLLQREIHE